MRRHALVAALVAGGVASAGATTAPTGSILYADRANDDWEIFIVHADGTGLRILHRQPGDDGEPTWSPDGRRIAFLGHGGVFAMDANGMNARIVIRRETTTFDWSPDGRRFAYAPWHGPVRVVDEGGRDRRVSQGASSADVAWSPDGRRVAFSNMGHELTVVGSEGSGERALAGNAADVDWSSRGRIAFSGRLGVWVVDADGTHRHRVARASRVEELRWSPDGRRLAFSTFDPTSGNVTATYVVRADGSHLHALRIPGGPAWSPDSRWVAVGRAGCSAGIWIVPAEGTAQPRHALRGCFDFGGLSWGPN